MTGENSYNLRDISVLLDMPVRGDIPPETVMSLLETTDLLRSKGIPHTVRMQIGSTVCGARSRACADFLSSGANKLLFIDSDIVWKPDDIIRLLAMSTAMDIVTAAYPMRHDPITFLIKGDSRITLNEHGCAPIDGIGLGFAIIDRRVIQTLSDNAQIIQYMSEAPMPHVFRFDVSDGQFRGEDIAFFADAKEAGYQCWLDPNITLGHVGKKIFQASLLDYVTVNRARAGSRALSLIEDRQMAKSKKMGKGGKKC